jgi:2-keto-4-pentenoate hydratase
MVEPEVRVLAALAAQLAERRGLLEGGARPIGWKVALGIEEIEQRIGTRPAIGYLTSATRLASGATHSATGAAELCVDAELAVEIGVDGGIAAYAAALELVDLGQARGSLEAVVRANVLHRAFVLGQSAPEPAVEARIDVDSRLRDRGVVAFDVEERVEVVRYWLTTLGERLEPGDRIITGSIAQVPVAPGDEVAVELAGLGRLDVRIVE